MIAFLLRTVVNAVAVWVAVWLLPGMDVVTGPAVEATGNETAGTVVTYLAVGLVFGIVNAVVKPVISLLALPLTCLTLGLFTIIINALMLMLTVWLTSFLPVGIVIDEFFWTAVLAAIVISIVSMLANGVLGLLVPARAER